MSKQIIIFNDLIWWIPFYLILSDVYSNRPSDKSIKFTSEEIEGFESRFRAKLVNSLTGLKPINLIGTVDNSGNENLSLVSSVVHLGSSPPLIGLFIRPDNVRRDTIENIFLLIYSFRCIHVQKRIIKSTCERNSRRLQARRPH